MGTFIWLLLTKNSLSCITRVNHKDVLTFIMYLLYVIGHCGGVPARGHKAGPVTQGKAHPQ